MLSYSPEHIHGFLARLKWRYFKSLRGRLIALSLCLSVTLLWILVSVSTTFQRQQFSAVLLEQQFASVRRLAVILDQNLKEQISVLTATAAGLPDTLTPQALNAHLARFAGLRSIFSAGVAVVGLDGRIIADYPIVPGRQGNYFGDRDYFIKAVRTEKPDIGIPVIGRALKRPVLPVAVPILDSAGNVRAVLVGCTDLNSSDFFRPIFDPAISGKGQFLIVSPQDHIIVAATDTTRALGEAPAPGVNRMYDRFVNGFEGSGIANGMDGVSKLYSGAQVPAAKWVFMASLPAEAAFHSVAVMRDYLIAIAVIMTLFAIVFAHWITRRMFFPLDEAGQAMRRMTQGAAPLAPLPVKRRDEVGGMIDNFNLLVEDHYRSESALADSEQRLRTLVENAPDAIVVQTRGCFAYVNAAALHLFGAHSKDQLLGQPVSSRVHPAMRAEVDARVELLNNARKNIPPVEEQILRLDGSVVHVEVSAIPYHYENEDGALVFVRDITERKHAEKALQESEARFFHLVALSSEWYWEYDENYRVTRIEGWSKQRSDRVPELVIGKAPWEVIHPNDEAFWEAHLALLDARLPFMDFEYTRTEPDGDVVWLSVSGEPMFTKRGVFKGYRGTGRNITHRKRTELALLQSQARIRELAAHQAQIKEDERKRIAREIHDELGQRLLTMRIDASMLAERTAGSHSKLHNKARTMLDNIDVAMKSVKSIINNLRPAVLDLGLLAAMEWQVRQFQRTSGIECVLDVDDEDFDRDLDENLAAALFRIAQEGLTNILRHASASQVHIAIRTGFDHLSMTITDDGVGIAPHNRNKKDSFGLAGIEERISALGGSFTIDSSPGKGTRLLISIPSQRLNHDDPEIWDRPASG